MLSVDEARDRILSHISPLEPVAAALLDALGLVLAEDIIARVDLPPFDNSAMDGYALRWEDTLHASPSAPVRLMVCGESAAGHPIQLEVNTGETVRIMTGALIPRGANAVVQFEAVRILTPSDAPAPVDHSAEIVEFCSPCEEWQNVRRAGEDVTSGSRVLTAGTLIGPHQIGLLAALNISLISVIRRPLVAILSTGDELVDLGPELRPGQIRDSNSYLIAAMVRQAGGVPRLLGIAGDSEDDIRRTIQQAEGADLIVTCGGVSVGDFDMVKDVLQQRGEIELWQVGIKPGKPMAFGFIGDTPLLGLPGNPVAAAVTFSQFGRPMVQRMLGTQHASDRRLEARLDADVWNHGGRRNFVRGNVRRVKGELRVTPVPQQGSGALLGLARANCYIVCDENLEHLLLGSPVDVELFEEERIP